LFLEFLKDVHPGITAGEVCDGGDDYCYHNVALGDELDDYRAEGIAEAVGRGCHELAGFDDHKRLDDVEEHIQKGYDAVGDHIIQ